MSVNFVKYCSLCDHENLSIASFCEKCDADLMNVPVAMRRAEGESARPEETDSSGMPAADTSPTVSNRNESSENQDTAGRQLDQNEQATRRASQMPGGILELELVENPSLRFQVRPGQTVGRSPRADVVLNGVPNLEYISRAHARFTQRRTQWYVQYIAEGNSITVDGVESSDDAEIALYDQSILVLSLCPFRVRLS